ncbi:predicted protein [Thalassiosira pseudonana CCMP1335]|uniref:RRM domain-containing protein n=1 Tax=Thalassiosira pseudonana TaxID=35128 RepID=B8BY01_THAPS|nr:predicted protein [Thalassiosira pseudonana CCMP1335]EED93799.1 predicted protein [Thalassiosira pseudonana CCMP1335]
MNELEMELYELNMENYTYSIGLNIGLPFIIPECTVVDQRLGTTRNRRMWLRSLQEATEAPTIDNITQDATVLEVEFVMNYTSRYGYEDIFDYPAFLVEFLNIDQDRISTDLQQLLNIESNYIVSSGIAYIDAADPTAEPTGVINTKAPATIRPTTQTYAPSSSIAPSSSPTDEKLSPTGVGIGVVVGVIIGGLVAAITAFVVLRKCNLGACAEDSAGGETPQNVKDGGANDNDADDANVFVAVPIEKNGHGNDSREAIVHSTMPQSSVENDVLSQAYSTTADSMMVLGSESTGDYQRKGTGDSVTPSILSHPESKAADATFVGANLMEREDSFSSDSDDGVLSPAKITYHDEFDKYKNQVLEKLRDEVEQSIQGVDGPMSLAMTRVFMEAEGKELDLTWVGAEDPGSIEASCFCETFDWVRQHKHSNTGTADDFFEDMLYKIVLIVHHGLIRPNDGARLLQGCASVLGLHLLKEPPKTTLIIRGLRKTNDLAQGHHFLLKEFAPYGDVVDASICPKNKGFGFVRFVQPKSAKAVLKDFDQTEIVVQDVAVLVTSLGRPHVS